MPHENEIEHEHSGGKGIKAWNEHTHKPQETNREEKREEKKEWRKEMKRKKNGNEMKWNQNEMEK